jgi:hypothetical protein
MQNRNGGSRTLPYRVTRTFSRREPLHHPFQTLDQRLAEVCQDLLVKIGAGVHAGSGILVKKLPIPLPKDKKGVER